MNEHHLRRLERLHGDPLDALTDDELLRAAKAAAEGRRVLLHRQDGPSLVDPYAAWTNEEVLEGLRSHLRRLGKIGTAHVYCEGCEEATERSPEGRCARCYDLPALLHYATAYRATLADADAGRVTLVPIARANYQALLDRTLERIKAARAESAKDVADRDETTPAQGPTASGTLLDALREGEES
jgi:hypothetical protein